MATPIDHIGQHELNPTLKALAKAGGTTDHADWIRSGENAARLIQIIDEQMNRGKAKAGPRRLIDCDAAPFIPEGWTIKPEDQLTGAVGGQLEFDPAKVLLYLDEDQKDGKAIIGNELKGKLVDKALLKANVLDHLLANANLIPEAWKIDEQGRTRYIFFWGTVYRGPDGDRCVRCLCWGDGKWVWDCNWLDAEFVDQDPAAILAS